MCAGKQELDSTRLAPYCGESKTIQSQFHSAFQTVFRGGAASGKPVKMRAA